MAMMTPLSPPFIFDDYAFLPSQHLKAAQIAPFDLKASSVTPEIIISIPHGGFHYIEDIASADYEYLSAMRSLEDSGTSLLKDMITLDNATILSAPLSRALIDLNRPVSALDPQLYKDDLPPPDPKDRFTRYIQAGYGVAPRLSAQKTALYEQKLDLASTDYLINNFHKPYHDKLVSLLHKSANYHGSVILMDIHSMPSHYGTLHGPIYAVQIEINRALYCKSDNKISCNALAKIADIISAIADALKDEITSNLAAE